MWKVLYIFWSGCSPYKNYVRWILLSPYCWHENGGGAACLRQPSMFMSEVRFPNWGNPWFTTYSLLVVTPADESCLEQFLALYICPHMFFQSGRTAGAREGWISRWHGEMVFKIVLLCAIALIWISHCHPHPNVWYLEHLPRQRNSLISVITVILVFILCPIEIWSCVIATNVSKEASQSQELLGWAIKAAF